MLMGGCQSIHQPLVCLSVPPTVRRHFDCPSISSGNCASVCPSLSLSTPVFLNIPRRFDRRLPVYPPDRPSVCLSVCLPVLSCFYANCQSPFRPQAVCLFTGCLSPFLTQTVRRGRVWLTQDEEGRQ